MKKSKVIIQWFGVTDSDGYSTKIWAEHQGHRFLFIKQWGWHTPANYEEWSIIQRAAKSFRKTIKDHPDSITPID